MSAATRPVSAIDLSVFPHMRPEHESVLLNEVLGALDLHDGQTIIDATLGLGGHSKAILRAARVRLIGLDADPEAAAFARERLSAYADHIHILEVNFRNLQGVVSGLNVPIVDRVLFDLGWNRSQLATGKGFSFQMDEPLNMSYGSEPVSGFSAADILNTWSEEAIGNVLFGYGNERYARRIARNVVRARRAAPVETTSQFVSLIASSVPAYYRRGKTHFATKSFQALRIAVNDELGSIERGIRGAWEVLRPGGRIAVITFHSTEDALVKKLFVEYARQDGKLLNRKPITPSQEEVGRNRAARSAKLRVIIKN